MAPCDFRRMNGGFNNVNPAGGQYIYHDPLQQQQPQQQYTNNDYYGGASSAAMLDPLHQFNNAYGVGAPTTVVMPAPAAANTAGVSGLGGGLSTNCTGGYHAEYDQQQYVHQGQGQQGGYGAGDTTTTTTMANCNQQSYGHAQPQQQQQQQQHYHHQNVAQHVVAAPPPAPQIPSSSYLATKHASSYDPQSHYLPTTTSSMDPMKPTSSHHPPPAPSSSPTPSSSASRRDNSNPPPKPKSVMISGLSEKPLTAGEIHNMVASRANEVITRYLPCVDFLVGCQQELRQGLAVNRRMHKGRMTPRQYYKSYLEPLPQRFWKKNHSIIPAQQLSDAMRQIQSLCRDARLAEHLGCENMKNAFLGGMRDGESWGLRKWLSKHGAALYICNDLELILTGMQKLDASSSFTIDLAGKLRNEAGYAHRRLVSDIPKAYQAFSSAHPYLPFFHRLESALKGLAEFDPEDDDVILIEDDDVEAEKAKAEKRKEEKRKKEEEEKRNMHARQKMQQQQQQQQRPRKRGREEMNGFGNDGVSNGGGGSEASSKPRQSSPGEIGASWASLSNTTNNSSLGGSVDDDDSDCEVVCVMVKKPGGETEDTGGDVGGGGAAVDPGGGGEAAPRLEAQEPLYNHAAFQSKTPSPDFSRTAEAQGVGNGGATRGAADGMNGGLSGQQTIDEPVPQQPEQYQQQKTATGAANQTLPIDGISNDGSAGGGVGNLDDSQFADAEQQDFLPSRGDWRCTQCTFLNMDYSNVCLMCESERSTGATNGNNEGGGDATAAAAVVEEEKKDFWEGGFGGASFPMPHSAASPAPAPAAQAEAAAFNPQTLEEIAEGMARTVEKVDFSPTNAEQPSDFWDVHWNFVVSVFAAVLRKKEAIWFLEPVEEEELRALGRPEYRSIVRHPLSFRCIIDGLTDKYRCRGRLSPSLEFNVMHGRDLLQAIDLVFLNALAYNGKEKTELRSDALRLRRYFWDRLRKKVAQDPTLLPTKRGETSGFVVVKDAVKNH